MFCMCLSSLYMHLEIFEEKDMETMAGVEM